MEALFRKLGITDTRNIEAVVQQLGEKQVEYLERLDNVTDEKRRQQLENELKEIETALASFSWLIKKNETGLKRDGESSAVGENLDVLKGQSIAEKPMHKKYQQASSETTSPESQQTPEEQYDVALAMMATPDYIVGVELLCNLGEGGYVPAQVQLGRMYFEGNRVPKDETVAAGWFQKAADQGDAYAQYSLGCMYNSGKGVLQSDGEAAEWFLKAATQGNVSAQSELGYRYGIGKGVLQDDRIAAEWLQKAANQGDISAQGNLGVVYRFGRGTQKNLARALEWYQKAAAHGNMYALEALFRIIAEPNNDMFQYKAIIVSWFQEEAEQGQAGVQYYFGKMYAEGEGVPYSIDQAREWYQKAAEQGLASAQCGLGDIYYTFQKEGVYLYELAMEWYQKAAEQGCSAAKCGLGNMYQLGCGVPQDCSKAMEWYQKAAEQGYTQAYHNIAKMYETGKGVPQNDSKALEYYYKAKKLGDKYVSGEIYKLEHKTEVKEEPSKRKIGRWFGK